MAPAQLQIGELPPSPLMVIMTPRLHGLPGGFGAHIHEKTLRTGMSSCTFGGLAFGMPLSLICLVEKGTQMSLWLLLEVPLGCSVLPFAWDG